MLNRPPSVHEVEQIAAIFDPVARNYRITRCYHQLAVALGNWLPDGANWCAFATWASRQAGQSIRGEDLRRTLERMLRESGEARVAAEALATESANISDEPTESLDGALDALHDAISPAAAFDRVADAVARGNRKVFAEIGWECARFLTLFADGPPDAAALGSFLDGLRPGDPPDGQRLLSDAFSHYYATLSATDDKSRAELMLLANLEIGFHEQQRLQPEIRAAMDAPIYEPRVLRRRLLNELFPNPASQLRLAAARMLGRAGPLLAARDRLACEMQRLGRMTITDVFMTLELSGERVLRLGEAVLPAYPPALREPSHAELLALLAMVEPPPGHVREVDDWGNLTERMGFIADLFRAYQTDRSLFDPPFTTE